MSRTPFRLRLTFIVGFVAVVWMLVIVAAVAVWEYRAAKKRALDTAESRLLGIAISAAALVDGDLHQEIVKGAEDHPEYQRLVTVLDRIREANSRPGQEIRDIYTVWRDPQQSGRVLYGLSTGKGGDRRPLNSLYGKPVSPVLLDVLRTGKARCEPEIAEDEQRVSRSAHAPILDPAGRVVAALGVNLVAKKTAAPAVVSLGALAAIAILLGVLLARILSPLIAVPLRRLNEAAARIAQGDLRTESLKTPAFREFAGLAAGFREMADHLRHLLNRIKEGVESIDQSAAALHVAAEQAGRGAAEIAQTMGEMAAGGGAIVASVSSAADELGRIDSLSAEVAGQTFAGSEAMLSVRSSADRGVAVVSDAVERAREAASLINLSTDQVETFERWSEEIARVLEFVSELAEQINMLSMNARIEAARAGEHGQGFSVIAEKIGKLADDAGHMVARISGLNAETVARVKDVGSYVTTTATNLAENARLLDQTKAIFIEIADHVRETSEMLVRTARSTAELRERIVKGRQSMDAMAAAAGETAGGIEEASAAAQEQTVLAGEVESTAAELRRLAELLRDELRRLQV